MSRRPPRLTGFDYSRAGAYFITICTQGRVCLLSEIQACQVKMTRIGNVVSECWINLPCRYSFIQLDTFIVMPNHFHGILWITDENSRRKSLGQLIGSFKAESSSRIKQLGIIDQKLWQSDFYEHIIRSEKELELFREYIANNPENWANDHNHPEYAGGYVPVFDKYENVTPATWLRHKKL
ncbi:MAG: hypothetical protein K2Y39_15505 [Candidatus Obscuribacterales bacterium]|nr:hypothetical protein [Candidatus Obscuribacterales bacterium]